MPNEPPFVTAFFVCERMLRETDEVLTAIRIVDKFILDITPLQGKDGPVPVAVQFFLFVSLRAGDLRGKHEIDVQVQSPSGKTTPLAKWPAEFTDAQPGAAFVAQIGLIPEAGYGVYRFDLLFDGEARSSLPITLIPRVAAAKPPVEPTTQEP